MILSEIRDYLQLNRRAAVVDMANRFNTSPDALRGMLEKLVAKGQIKKLPAGTACSGCSDCDPVTVEIYEWIGDIAGDISSPIKMGD
jgi:hypothetical protein